MRAHPTLSALKRAMLQVLDRALPAGIKKSLLHAAFNLAPVEFETFAYRYAFAPNMALGLKDFAKRGFIPKTIVDVGAFRGEWGALAKRIWPSSRLLMVEPNLARQPQLAAKAKELDAAVIDDLLGAEDGRVVQFNIMESGSSVLTERSAVPRTVEARRLRTLDNLLTDIETPAFLKVDAQGYELEILRGATKCLPAFHAILLEIAIIEINEGAPLLHEALAYMKLKGFVTYDILQIHRRPLDGALNQIDLLFVREDSDLIADKRHFA